MRDAITNYLPWLMSAVTIVAIEMQGRKWPRAWALSLAGQGFWFVWIWASGQWGFMPMAAVLCFQYARNHLRWNRPAKADAWECCAEEGARLPCENCTQRHPVSGACCGVYVR